MPGGGEGGGEFDMHCVQTDVDDRQKMQMLERLYKGSQKEVKRPDKVYVVSAKGGKRKAKHGCVMHATCTLVTTCIHSAKVGKPVLVDPRMKKDKRATVAGVKRKAKKSPASVKKRRRG
jgi:hypothetical protein